MLTIKDLSVVYPDGTKAVDTLSFSVKDGENVALIGANGAGKTSLIMALVGILASTGTVSCDGTVLEKNTIEEMRRKLGIVFQNPDDQLFMPTIYDDVAFGLRNMGMTEDVVKEKSEDCLRKLGIEKLAPRTALKISGGEKRMAAIATVLAMEPSVMIMDEPTAFLDPKARRNLIETLRTLPHSKLIATHDLTFAAQLCQRSVLIKEGKVFADGPSKDLLYDRKLMEDCGVEAIGAFEGERI